MTDNGTATAAALDSELPPPAASADAGAWLDLKTALTVLGISERTLHRRASAGDLQRRSLPGGRTEYWVSSARHDMAPPAASQELPPDPERALVLVERVNLAVNQQIAPLLEMVRDLQDRNGELERENGRLQAELDAARTAATAPASHDTRAWWQRWFWSS